jgi:hypothetical protein
LIPSARTKQGRYMYKDKYDTFIVSIDYETKIVTFAGGISRAFTDEESAQLQEQLCDQIIAYDAGEDLSIIVNY